MKNIYQLDLHESVIVKVKPIDGRGYPYEMQVTRLPSGWLYTDNNPTRKTACEFFVPFDNRFQSDEIDNQYTCKGCKQKVYPIDVTYGGLHDGCGGECI